MNQEEYLRFQMEFHRWSPDDLARFAGIRKHEVEALLHGHQPKNGEVKMKISRCLGVNPEVWHRL